MGTRNAEERRKAAGKHRKESFSVKLEVVARYEPQADKSFLFSAAFSANSLQNPESVLK